MTASRARLQDRLPAGLPPSLTTLTTPCYVHRAGRLAVGTVLATMVAVVLAALFFIGSRWLSGKSDGGEIAMGAFLVFFLIILLRPSLWSAPVTLAADSRGVYFVGGKDSRFVPWQEIGPSWLETAYPGDHPEHCAVLAIKTDSTFWDAGQSRFMQHALPSERPPGYRPVPVATQGVAPRITQESLEALRGLSGVAATWAPYDPGPGRRAGELVAAGLLFLAMSIFFLLGMLRSYFRGQGIGLGFVIPVILALAGAWMVRYGWKRRR